MTNNNIKENKFIEIRGAKVNNLDNIDINIPQGKFIVIAGVSLSLIHI